MEWVIPALLVVCLFSVVFAGYALHISIGTRIELAAMQKSTHNIQFVPVDPNADANDAAAARAMDKQDDEAMKRVDQVHGMYSPGEI